MTDTPAPLDGRRAGATWVAATGAFLLVAAAAVFIAVRWDTLPEEAKLGLVGALTGGFLVGGRALRRTLPSTGDVLFHLGAFLLPVDVAGLHVRLGLGWRALLLSEGVVGVAALGALAAGTGSVVLGGAAAVSMVVLALSVAAVTAAPAPLVLAAAAAVAVGFGRRRLAIGWAAVAGLAPLLGAGAARVLAVAAGRDLGAGTLEELGLAGGTAAWFAMVSGVVSAGVLAREAGRSRDLGLAALAGVSLLSGAGTTWAASEPSLDEWALALPALFVTLQLTAIVAERDDFWRRPARTAAFLGELLALPAAAFAAVLVLAAPIVEEGLDFFSDVPGWRPEPAAALAWTLVATGWILAAWRRRSPQPSLEAAAASAATDDRTVAFAACALAAGLVVGTASTVAIAGGLLVLGTALLASRRVVASLVAVPLLAWAPIVLAVSQQHLVVATALVSAAVFVVAARRAGGSAAVALTIVAGVVVAGASAFTAGHHGEPAAGLLLAVFGGWAAAAVVEGRSWAAGVVARVPMVLAAVVATGHDDTVALPVVLAATFLLVIDAVRTDDPRLGAGAGATFPLLVVVAARAGGLGAGDTGLVLALGALVLGGLAVLTPDRWRLPVAGAGAWSMVLGLGFATEDPRRFAQSLVVAGAAGVAAGVLFRQRWVGHAGGALVVLATALHLSLDEITVVEAYLAPVALQLAVLGWQIRRHAAAGEAPSSWVAYGPSMGLVIVPALVERLDGGPAGHALVAGAVAVTGVALGGWHRLAGPLLLGTGTLVTITVLESLHTLAGVPTWGWLAAGGTVLLATGVALERTATSPVEAGRRLVDEVASKFD